MTPEEELLFEDLKPYWETYKQTAGSVTAKDIKELLSKRWCRPTISVTGIQASGKGSVISRKVVGSLSIRYVPNQTATELIEKLSSFVKARFERTNSPNKVALRVLRTGDWWLGDRKNKFYTTAAKAIQKEWYFCDTRND